MLHHLTLGRTIGDNQDYVTDLDWQMYCEELLDAIGIEYKQCEDDDTQNEVLIEMTQAEFTDVVDQSLLSMTNEQTLAAALLNLELSEYTTKVTAYLPSGDNICFT